MMKPAQISKTTLMGWLVCFLAAKDSVHFDAAGHLSMMAKDWFGLGVGFAIAWLGHQQEDADRLSPNSPGNPTPEAQAAHPVADDPAVK